MLLLAALAIASTVGQTYSLILQPTQDRLSIYKMEMRMDVQEHNMSVSTELLEKVLKVETNGDYTLRNTTRNTQIKLDGVDQGANEEMPPTEEVYNSKGLMITKSSDDSEDSFFTALSEASKLIPPSAPVEVGEKWTVNVDTDAKKGTVGYRTEFTLAGKELDEGQELLIVKFKYVQKEGTEPLKADGSYYLSAKDFALVRSDIEATNFKPFAESDSATVHLKLKRISVQ